MSLRLRDGERVLWQGVPDPRPLFNAHRPMGRGQKIGISLLCGGLGAMLLLLVGPRVAGSPLMLAPVVVLVAPLFAAVWYFAFDGKRHADAFWRRRTCYTLTDRRAVTELRVLGLPLRSSWPVKGWTPVTWNGETPGSVHFKSYVSTVNGVRSRHTVAFLFIPDAPLVYDLMRGLQERAA